MTPNKNISQELLENAERYYSLSMTGIERTEFENKLKNDLDFKTQVEAVKVLIDGIESQSLKEKLNDFHKEILTTTSADNISAKEIRINYRKLAAAAIIIIAIGSFWFYTTNTNDKLYSEYFKPDPGLPTVMGNTANYEFYNAMVDYKRGEYSIAIEKWEKLLQLKPSNDTINYFIGVAYLANGDQNEAIKFLNSAIEQNNSIFKNETYYYLGLAHLKNKNVKLAKENLNFSTMDKSKLLLSKIND